MLHNTNNAENKGAALAISVGLGQPPPFTMTLDDGSPFADIDLPFYITLAAQAETEDSPVEIFEVTARPGADTFTISERSVNGTEAQTWFVGDKVQVRHTGANQQELVEEVRALTLAKVMGNIIGAHNYG